MAQISRRNCTVPYSMVWEQTSRWFIRHRNQGTVRHSSQGIIHNFCGTNFEAVRLHLLQSVQYGFLWLNAQKLRQHLLLVDMEFEGRFCLSFSCTFFEKNLERRRESIYTENEAACWSKFRVEISWFFYCNFVSDFYPEEIINSLSLSDWFSPSGFFQGHWPKILSTVCLNGMLNIYLLLVKYLICSNVLSLKILFIFRTLFFLRMS